MKSVVTRRHFFFHGFIILLFAFLFGIPVVVMQGYDQKLWLAAHVSGILGGLLLVALGAVWDEVGLSPALQRVTQVCALVSAYTSLLILGLFNSIIGAPLKALG